MGNTDYDDFMKMPLNELTRKAVGSGTGSSLDMAKFVYDQRMIEKQHEYAKQQIELQHVKNMELLKKQLRWIKVSIIANALAVLIGFLLGWFLGESKMLPSLSKIAHHRIESQATPIATNNETIHNHRETPDKVP